MKVDGSKVRIALAGVIIGVLLGAYIGFSASPSTTQIIGGGIYPGAPSYTIWKEGSNYFAKNANGEIVFSGTSASQVVQNTIDIMNEGELLFLKAGVYQPFFITINKAIHIKGEMGAYKGNIASYGTSIRDGDYGGAAQNKPMINITLPSTFDDAAQPIILEDLSIVHWLDAPSDYAISVTNAQCIFSNLHIDCHGKGGGGIEFSGSGATTGFTTIENCRIRRFTNLGVYIHTSSGSFLISNCHIESYITSAKACVEFEQTGGSTITGGEYVCAYGAGILLDRSGRNHIENVWFEACRVSINMTDETATSAEGTHNNVVLNCIFASETYDYYNVVFDWASRNIVLYPWPWDNATNTNYAALFTAHSRYNRIEGFKVLWMVNYEIEAGALGSIIVDEHGYFNSTRDSVIPQTDCRIWNLDDHNWNIYNGTHWVLPDGTET